MTRAKCCAPHGALLSASARSYEIPSRYVEKPGARDPSSRLSLLITSFGDLWVTGRSIPRYSIRSAGNFSTEFSARFSTFLATSFTSPSFQMTWTNEIHHFRVNLCILLLRSRVEIPRQIRYLSSNKFNVITFQENFKNLLISESFLSGVQEFSRTTLPR